MRIARNRPVPGTCHRGAAIALWAALNLSGCASNINDILAEMEYGDPDAVKESIVEVGDILSRKESAGYELDGGEAFYCDAVSGEVLGEE